MQVATAAPPMEGRGWGRRAPAPDPSELVLEAAPTAR